MGYMRNAAWYTSIDVKMSKGQTCKIAGHTKLPSKSYKNAKATKFLSKSAFYISKGSAYKVLPIYDFWFTFYDRFCSPYPMVDFLGIFSRQNKGL